MVSMLNFSLQLTLKANVCVSTVYTDVRDITRGKNAILSRHCVQRYLEKLIKVSNKALPGGKTRG